MFIQNEWMQNIGRRFLNRNLWAFDSTFFLKINIIFLRKPQFFQTKMEKELIYFICYAQGMCRSKFYFILQYLHFKFI